MNSMLVLRSRVSMKDVLREEHFFFAACESRPEEEEREIGLSTTDSNIVCIIYYFLPMGNCMTHIDRGTS